MSDREVICNRADETICHDCDCAVPHIREGAPGWGWCTEWQRCHATRLLTRCTRVPLDAGKE